MLTAQVHLVISTTVFLVKLDECQNKTLNNCWNDPNAECVDQNVGYACKCNYEDLGVNWDNAEGKCQLPNGGKLDMVNYYFFI